MNRDQIIAKYRKQPDVSVLIIGAGVNGIGTFRDLSLNGVDVLIVDRGDFCSGTSAASSHMVHGGIRYLEYGEFRLVKEAIRERNRLIKNAPHYVKPLPTTIPIFKWLSGLLIAPFKFIGLSGKPAERGALLIKTGLMMYDAYTKEQGTVSKHKFELRKSSLEQFPKLNPEIICTATYYDGSMPSPERICMDMVLDAEELSSKAKALNYVSVTGVAGKQVILQDSLNGEDLVIEPKIVVNAAGPWIDVVNQKLDQKVRLIGGTKGSHLVLDHPELRDAIGGNEFFFENKDGRLTLIFPLMDKVLVGTSDLRIDNPDDVYCSEEEIDYFIDMIKVVFPSITVDRSDIVFQFSGVRPLPYSQADYTEQISRDHSINVIEPQNNTSFPIFSLVGGKWTSFRAFSEEVTDLILQYLGLTRLQDTKNLPIGGGVDYPTTELARDEWIAAQASKTQVPPDRIEVLLERYGTHAACIADFIAAGGDQPLENKPDFSRREIEFLVQNEKVLHLDDLVLRRTLLAKLGDLNLELLHELAQICAEQMGWLKLTKEEEINRTKKILWEHHGVSLGHADT